MSVCQYGFPPGQYSSVGLAHRNDWRVFQAHACPTCQVREHQQMALGAKGNFPPVLVPRLFFEQLPFRKHFSTTGTCSRDNVKSNAIELVRRVECGYEWVSEQSYVTGPVCILSIVVSDASWVDTDGANI